MTTLFVAWIAFAVASAMSLSRFGKAGKGLLLGILGGPFGLIIALVMRSNALADEQKLQAAEVMRREREARDESEFNERECPFCAERIRKRAVVCKHCGRDVQPVTAGAELDRPWQWPTPD